MAKGNPNDYVHGGRYGSIYQRTDYITNLSMVIPFSLAAPWVHASETQPLIHHGFPQQDRGRHESGLSMANANSFPEKKLPFTMIGVDQPANRYGK